jgi:hypothetical protein
MSLFSQRVAGRLARAIRPHFDVLEDRSLPSCNVIAGFVYLDANNNGLLDAGEAPIGGSTLELRNASGAVIATTTSNAAGYYEFSTDGTVATTAILPHSTAFANAKTNTTQTASVPQFDSELGTLTSVEIIINGQITSNISVENIDDHLTSILGNVSGSLTVSGPRFSTIVTTSTQSESFDAQPYDGVTDFAGPSGKQFGAKTVTGSRSLQITNATDLTAYVGTGTVSLREVAQANSAASGGGNLVAQISSRGGAEITVIYHYTPSNCLKPGSYTIVQTTQPAGLLDGKESRAGVVLSGSVGQDQINVTLGTTDLKANNFGELLPARLKGLVYADDNDNGVQESGERGIGNVAVRLTGVDDLGRSVSLNMQTTTDGKFVFKGLRPGVYSLTETQPAGWNDGKDTLGTQGGSRANDQFSGINLGAGAVGRQYLFGELRPISIAGFVYVDRDDDGLRESGETGIGGVLITLTGLDDKGQAVSRQTTTLADGSYKFDNLRPGMYMLTETQPSFYRDGKDTAGTLGGTVTNDQLASIAAGPADDGAEYNFGELLPNIEFPQGNGGKIDFTGTNDPRRGR